MKRADLADTIGDVTFADWSITPVGLRAMAKIAGVPNGRVWVTETPGQGESTFTATIGFDVKGGGKLDTHRHDSAFGALAEAVKLLPQIAPPDKARRAKPGGQGPLFGGK